MPYEILHIDGINMTEKFVLALYKQNNEAGCIMTNEDVCKFFYYRFCIRQLKRIKKHLKELGYIKTDGINVIYLGVKKHTNKEQ